MTTNRLRAEIESFRVSDFNGFCNCLFTYKFGREKVFTLFVHSQLELSVVIGSYSLKQLRISSFACYFDCGIRYRLICKRIYQLSFHKHIYSIGRRGISLCRHR